MEQISQSALKEILEYYYPAALLKSLASEALEVPFNGRSKTDSIDVVIGGLSSREILDFIFGNIHIPHQNLYTLELDDDRKSLVESKVKQAIKALSPSSLRKEPIVHIEREADDLSFQGLIQTAYEAYLYDPESENYLGEKKEYPFLLPFKIKFAPPRHIKVSFFKFTPGQIHKLANGDVLFIKRTLFDAKVAIEALKKGPIGKVTNHSFRTANLVTGLKVLIQARKLSAIRASAEDPGGEGVNQRAKNNTNRGVLLEYRWLKRRILPSTRIQRAKWFWIEGKPHVSEIKGLASLSIDPDLGMCSKDRAGEEDFEWIVDELIKQNDKTV